MDEDDLDSGPPSDADVAESTFAAAAAAAAGVRGGQPAAPDAEPPAPADATPAEPAPPPEPPPAAEDKPDEEPDTDDWRRMREYEARLARQREQLAEERRKLAEERRNSDSELTRLLARAKAGDLDAQEELVKAGYFDYTGITRRRLGEKQQKGSSDPEVAKLREKLERLEREREEIAAAQEREERIDVIVSAARSAGDRYALVLDEFEHNRAAIAEGFEAAMATNPQLTMGQGLANLERYLRARVERQYKAIARHSDMSQSVPAHETQRGTPRDQLGSHPAGVSGVTDALSSERGSPPRQAPRTRMEEDEDERALLAEAARLVRAL